MHRLAAETGIELDNLGTELQILHCTPINVEYGTGLAFNTA
jgi:hypothetical protein